LTKKLIAFFIASSFLSSALGAEISRPGFDQNRVFKMGSPTPATPLPIEATQAYVFNDALSKCQRDVVDLENELHDFLERPDSEVLLTLKKFFPSFLAKDLKSVQIFFDSFGSLAQAFASFYIPAQKNLKPTISLDCSQQYKFLTPSLLGHELAHHFNSKRGLSPWIDEMIAQMTEIRIKGSFSLERYEAIRNSYAMPSFFAREKAFKSTHEYGINALFGAYLMENYGGAEVLSAIPNGTKTLSQLSQAVVQFSKGKKDLDWIRPYMGPRALIRHFNLALNINLPSVNGGKIFKVPGWRGFAYGTTIKKVGSYIIEPGGSLRLDPMWGPDFKNFTNSSSLELYRVLIAGNQYQIATIDEAVNGYWEQNFLVLINTSETEYTEIRLQ
jgi:hypothetical protein